MRRASVGGRSSSLKATETFSPSERSALAAAFRTTRPPKHPRPNQTAVIPSNYKTIAIAAIEQGSLAHRYRRNPAFTTPKLAAAGTSHSCIGYCRLQSPHMVVGYCAAQLGTCRGSGMYRRSADICRTATARPAEAAFCSSGTQTPAAAHLLPLQQHPRLLQPPSS